MSKFYIYKNKDNEFVYLVNKSEKDNLKFHKRNTFSSISFKWIYVKS